MNKLENVFWYGFISVVALVFVYAIYLTFHTTPITGRITKLQAETFNHFAVVETGEGKRQSVSVSAADYVLLELNSTCTFQLNNRNEAQSVTCKAEAR